MASGLFDTFVLPISGTDFVRYVACLSLLAQFQKDRGQAPIKPSVIYAASGGCLTAYIAMMSEFTSNVEEWNIASDMFIDKATPVTPRLLTFAIRGALYRRADITEYVKSIFIPSLIQDVEIVSGYYEQFDPDTFKHIVRLVTNYPKSSSAVGGFTPPNKNTVLVFADEPPQRPTSESTDQEKLAWSNYLNGVMSSSIDTLHKTSNIPFMMEAIGEAEAIDFGIVSPSPRLITNANLDKSIYFSPINLDRTGRIKNYEMIFHQFIMNDLASIRNQFSHSKTFIEMDPLISLKKAFEFIADKSRYCLVLYTTATVELPIDSFSSGMAKYYFQACKTGIRCLLFYDQA